MTVGLGHVAELFADEVGAQIPAGIVQGITGGMPAVAQSLAISPSQFHVGGLPAARDSIPTQVTVNAMLDTSVLFTAIQTVALRKGERNTVNLLTRPTR